MLIGKDTDMLTEDEQMFIEFDVASPRHILELTDMIHQQVHVHNGFEQIGRPFVDEAGTKRYMDWLIDEHLASGEGHCLFYLDGDEFAGVVVYEINPTYIYDTRECFIEELFVREEFRRRGIARKMLAEVEKIARENDCSLMGLTCLNNNTAGKALYNAYGMSESKTHFMMELNE